MRHSKPGVTRCILMVAAALSLAGCLSKEEGATGGANENPGGGGSGNSAPTISGTPGAIVAVGNDYAFTPSASDPDGDTLTFTADGVPGWATFDGSTGTLSGRPAAGHVGMYSDIRITVSDGSLSAVLGPFSVEVTDAALGSVTVSWSMPSQYSDGSALTGHVTGVNLYYGTAQGSYPNKIPVTNTGTTTHVVENLVPDTYFFVATIVDDQGVESNWSNIGSATVQ